MAYTNPWTVNTPVGSQPANQIWAYIQQVRQDLQDRLVQQFWLNMTDDPLKFKPEFLAKVGQGPQEFVVSPFAGQNVGQSTNPNSIYPVFANSAGLAQALDTGGFWIPLTGFPLGRRITRVRAVVNSPVNNTISIILNKIVITFSTFTTVSSVLGTYSTPAGVSGTRTIDSGVLALDIPNDVISPAPSVTALFLTYQAVVANSLFRGASVTHDQIP